MQPVNKNVYILLYIHGEFIGMGGTCKQNAQEISGFPNKTGMEEYTITIATYTSSTLSRSQPRESIHYT